MDNLIYFLSLSNISLVSIGPFTSEELKKFDVSYTVAEIHTVAGAFDTLKNFNIE